jgi:hypothetical protein
MMRIAWAWYEMTGAGIPTALHINGRTDHDFVRWGEFAKTQTSLRAIAFEFLTGAEPKDDGRRYVDRLKRFAAESGRNDLLLVLRGGAVWMDELKTVFPRILLIDSGPYFKTVKRQRAELGNRGKLTYRSHTTKERSEVRALFLHNADAKLSYYAGAFRVGMPFQGQLAFDNVQAKPIEVSSEPKLAQVSQHDLFDDDAAGNVQVSTTASSTAS